MQKMKIDKRKKWILLVDVETAGPVDDPVVYDVGYAVSDRMGNIIFSRHYVVHEVFNLNPDLMRTAYYAYKIPRYNEEIQNGTIRVKRFWEIKHEVLEVMRRLKIERVAAYNCQFDRRALNNTCRLLSDGKDKYFFPYKTDFWCIWNMACQVICTQKMYLQFCKRYGYESAAGNCSTNAETVYRYLTGNPAFLEEHMGLEDVEIETQILAHCLRQHKKMKRGIYRLCWRIPQQAYKALTA